MRDPGLPTSYLALEEGTPVVTSDGHEIGTVRHVLAEPGADVFDGIIVTTDAGHRFVDAPEVDALYEREVRLKIDAEAAQRLPEPSENPPALTVDPAAPTDSGLSGRLRRAWDYLSGNY